MPRHNVIHYECLVTGKIEIPHSLKFIALKKSIMGLIERGRVVIDVNYAEARNPHNDFVVGSFGFDTIYLGRKSVKRNGVRHSIRYSHRKFKTQPISIPL